MEHKVNELQTKLKQVLKELGQSGVTPGMLYSMLLLCQEEETQTAVRNELGIWF